MVAVSIPLLFFLQLQTPGQGVPWAFRPADLEAGRIGGLFTSMLLHGGWAHAVMNAVGALTFGAPVARLLGGRRGGAAFLSLYVMCGVAGALGFGLVHWGSTAALVGASGAVFGLIGASSRIVAGGEAAIVLPLFDRRVLTQAAAWMAVNLIAGVAGLSPGMEGARIAWEAHAFGFLAGAVLVGPAARGFARRIGETRAGAPVFAWTGGSRDP